MDKRAFAITVSDLDPEGSLWQLLLWGWRSHLWWVTAIISTEVVIIHKRAVLEIRYIL